MLFSVRLLSCCLILLYINTVSSLSTQPSRLSRIGTVDHVLITHNSNNLYKRQENSTSFTLTTTTAEQKEIVTNSGVKLRFTAFDRHILLDLERNDELFHPNASVTIFNKHATIESIESIQPLDYFVYKGHTNNNKGEWARITLRRDLEHLYPFPVFEGAFTLDSEIYHVKTRHNFKLSKRVDDPEPSDLSPMVIYKDSDQYHVTLEKRDKSFNHSIIMCAMEEMAYNRRMTGFHTTNESAFASLWERDDPVNVPTSPNALQGCPTSRKIAYMGAAADCTYVTSYGSVRYAKLQMINDWNVASALYEKTFNVSLGLIYLQLSVPECPSKPKKSLAWNQVCSTHYSINDRLSDFSLWRGKKGDDSAALWHLMTKCSTGAKVGIAWLSQLCETQVSQQVEDDGSYEWVSGTGVSSITRDEWKVVAHEIGHGFGAIHDCTSYSCPCQGECGCCPLSDTVCSAGNAYIMNPTSNVTTNDFSPCSVNDICNTLPSIGHCLKSPDLRTGGTFSLCGNGILEPGEECDPGLTDSACCYAKTCKLKPGAVCDDYSNQCCLGCAIAPAETVCRPAVSECDKTEYCTGDSDTCPPDLYDPDGSSCANGTMNCASGICTSRDQQCMARGLRQNISEQCSFQTDSCLISCTDPKDPRNCLMLSGMFLDGTECGLAGFCRKGTCVSTGVFNTLKAWVRKNKSIAIPVFLFGSIAVILAIGWIAWFIVRRRRHKRRIAEKEKDSRPPSVVKISQDIELVEVQQQQQQQQLQHLQKDSQDETRRNNFMTKSYTHRRGKSLVE